MYKRQINAYADKCAAKGDDKGIVWSAILGSSAISFVLYWIPVSAACYLGAAALSNFTTALPDWVVNGLGVVGGILPAIGVGATMLAIGRRDFLPFFVFGFFICQYTGIGLSLIHI